MHVAGRRCSRIRTAGPASSHLDGVRHLKQGADMPKPVAVVTGVSSGIGNATAAALVAAGYRVFGTARSAASALPAGVERVLLDVRDGASIDAGVRRALGRAGRNARRAND